MAKEMKKTSAKDWAKQQAGSGFEPTAVKLPQGMEYYKPEPGTHIVDVMPYVVGDHNPRADKGFTHFERQYAVHRVPIPNGNTQPYCCLWECFKKECPVCLYIRKKEESGNSELAKSMKAQVRHLWIVNDAPGNEKNKLKVLDSNHYAKGLGFGEMMADAINEEPNCEDFSDLENGMSVKLIVKEDSFPSKGGQMVKFNKITKVTLVPRKHTYSSKMLQQVTNQVCLDDCVIQTSAKELKKILNQEEDSDEQEDNERPTASSSNKHKQDATVVSNGKKEDTTASDLCIVVSDYVMYDGEECEVLSISDDETSLTLENEDGQKYKNVSPIEVKRIKVKEDEKRAAGVTVKKPAAKATKDDEDDDEDLVPARSSKKPASPAVDEDDDDLDDMDSELEDDDD